MVQDGIPVGLVMKMGNQQKMDFVQIIAMNMIPIYVYVEMGIGMNKAWTAQHVNILQIIQLFL